MQTKKKKRKRFSIIFNPGAKLESDECGEIRFDFMILNEHRSEGLRDTSITSQIHFGPLGGFAHLNPTIEQLDLLIERLQKLRSSLIDTAHQD